MTIAEVLVNSPALAFLQKEGYEIRNLIGEGSFGCILSSWCNRSNRRVAIKCIENDKTWELENQLWPTFHHENILPLIRNLTSDNFQLFVMPYHPSSMFSVIGQNAFYSRSSAVVQILRWFVDILEGLAYLHGRNICHLDLKADNVLISCENTAVICDFSVVNTTDEPVPRYALVPKYRPPECFGQWTSIYGVPFDMWSFAIMALNTITYFSIDRSITDALVWERDVMPFLRTTLQIQTLHGMIQSAYPASLIDENLVAHVLNLLQATLCYRQQDRPAAALLLQHRALKEDGILLTPDHLWNCTEGEAESGEDQEFDEFMKIRARVQKTNDNNPSAVRVLTDHLGQGDNERTANTTDFHADKPESGEDQEFDEFINTRARVQKSNEHKSPSDKVVTVHLGEGDNERIGKQTDFHAEPTELKEEDIRKKRKANLFSRAREWMHKRITRSRNTTPYMIMDESEEHVVGGISDGEKTHAESVFFETKASPPTFNGRNLQNIPSLSSKKRANIEIGEASGAGDLKTESEKDVVKGSKKNRKPLGKRMKAWLRKPLPRLQQKN